MDFCEKLQQLRTKNGLTQEQLAEKVYVSRVAVSKWESGRGYPNLDSLRMLAKVFNLTIDELLSTDELIDIVEVQTKNKSRILLTLILGITDFMAILLFVIPMFANRFENKIDNVTLQNLTQVEFYTKISLIVVACFSIFFGFLELTLQNIQSKIKQKLEVILSGIISSFGIILAALTHQPYCCIFYFFLFLIKVLVTIKTEWYY